MIVVLRVCHRKIFVLADIIFKRTILWLTKAFQDHALQEKIETVTSASCPGIWHGGLPGTLQLLQI
jgi:hypothetical protein